MTLWPPHTIPYPVVLSSTLQLRDSQNWLVEGSDQAEAALLGSIQALSPPLWWSNLALLPALGGQGQFRAGERTC